MHVPDGFLSSPVCLTTGVLSAVIAGYCSFKAIRSQTISPKIGFLAGMIFTAQMLNFPILGGTSGHLLGSALLGILLGPCVATYMLTCVLVTQMFLFHDGGLLTLGANIFNIAIVGVWTGWAVYHLCGGNKRPALAAFVAGWGSVIAAAVSCTSELLLSNNIPAGVIFSAMLDAHVLVGLTEAIVTGGVIWALRPQFHSSNSTWIPNSQGVAFLTLVLLFFTPFACSRPDGLHYVSQILGLSSTGTTFQISFGFLRSVNSLDYTSQFFATFLGASAVAFLVALFLQSPLHLWNSWVGNRSWK